MAKVGGRQLTLGACGLTKFAETADGRKVQLHIPKYVQGPVGRACRYADRGCPFRSQRGTALSSHERSCKKFLWGPKKGGWHIFGPSLPPEGGVRRQKA